VYFVDSGLVCHLLGIDSLAALKRSAFLGPIFEGQVASEIVKAQINRGKRREIYFSATTRTGVDFVVPTGPGRLAFIEAKSTQTLRRTMARGCCVCKRRATATRPTRLWCAPVPVLLASAVWQWGSGAWAWTI